MVVRRISHSTRSAVLAVVAFALISQAAPPAPVVVQCCAPTWKSDAFGAICENCSGVMTIGTNTMGNEIGWQGVVFPAGDLDSIIVVHGGVDATGPTTLMFSIDGPMSGTGTPFTEVVLQPTGGYCTLVSTSFPADPGIKGFNFSGARDLWITITHGGGTVGEGCGNWGSFTFKFASTASARGVNAPRALRSNRQVGLITSGARIPALSAVYDMRGRALKASSASRTGIRVVVHSSMSAQ